MFVLFDFLWCDAARAVRGVQLAERTHVLRDSEKPPRASGSSAPACSRALRRRTLDFRVGHHQRARMDQIAGPEELREFLSESLRSFTEAHSIRRPSVSRHEMARPYKGLELDSIRAWYDSLNTSLARVPRLRVLASQIVRFYWESFRPRSDGARRRLLKQRVLRDIPARVYGRRCRRMICSCDDRRWTITPISSSAFTT